MEDRRVLALAAPVNYDTGANPLEIETADFNNDGVLDLATVNNVDSTVSVLLGNADGTFQPALTSPTGANPLSVAVGDFNEDGILDLATTSGYGYYGEASILLGNDDGTGKGTGTFQPPTSVSVGSPTSVAVGDFNGDGHLDLGVTSAYYYGWYYGYYSYANVLLGNGSGGFSAPHSTWLDWGYHTSATAANVNGDVSPTGHAIDDFVAVNSDYGIVSVLLGDAGGFLQPASYMGVGSYPQSVAIDDVNGDLAIDLVVANRLSNDVSVLLGTGGGGFDPAQNYATGSEPTSTAIGDFNGDTKPDIATTNFGGNDISVLYGQGGGTFSPALSFANPGGYDLAAGDFNGDGWLDAATANPNTVVLSVLLNDQAWPAAPASLSIGDATVTEGDSGTVAAVFTVTRSGENLAGSVTVNYSTANGAALAGSDYVAQSGTLTFADGVAAQTVTILVNGDLTDEFDQGFYVNLSGASGAVITDSQGFGNILDNDEAPTITITDVSGKEGHHRKTTSFVFLVTLSAASEKTISVTYATADGTATTADGDYFARTGTLVFAPGTTSQTISILVKGDKKKESNETFSVILSGATNATIADGTGIGNILGDDSTGNDGKHGRGKG